MDKKTKTFRYEADVIKHAENNFLIPSFAEWASAAYRTEFMNAERKTAQLREAREQVKQLEKELSALQGRTEAQILNQKEIEWIRNGAKARIKKATFEGVFKSFVNRFGRRDLNRRQFQLLVDKYG